MSKMISQKNLSMCQSLDFGFKFHEELQYLCMKSAFAQLLNYYGFQHELLYLKTGFEIKIQVKDNQFNTYKQWPCNPFFEMNKVEMGHGSDFEKILEQNLIKAPTILLVDVFDLPFRNEYHQYHAGHFILLFDYDHKSEQVGIVDWYVPHFFKGYLNITDFKKARTSENPTDVFEIFSGKAIDNYWYHFDPDIKLLTTKENYDLNIEDILRSIQNSQDKIYSGIEALLQIREFLPLVKQDNETLGKNMMKNYHNQLFIYYRTSLLAKKYFSMAEEILHIKSARKYYEFSASCYEILANMNFLFLQNSVRFSASGVEQLILSLEDLIKQYEKITGGST